jgi:hypothetical protein
VKAFSLYPATKVIDLLLHPNDFGRISWCYHQRMQSWNEHCPVRLSHGPLSEVSFIGGVSKFLISVLSPPEAADVLGYNLTTTFSVTPVHHEREYEEFSGISIETCNKDNRRPDL